MKKLIATLCIIVATLIFVTPHARERFERLMMTDNPAAATSGSSEVSERGRNIVDCLNRRTLIARWWGRNDAVRRMESMETAYIVLQWPRSSSYHFIHGTVGWHTTWMALISHETKPVTAHDLYGAVGGSMWAMAIPSRVIGAFKRCGVVYEGTWQGELPSGF